MLNHYELLYLVSANYTEEELVTVKEKIKDLIKKFGGQVSFEDSFGKKKLSYPIKGEVYGYYFLHEFDVASSVINNIDASLRVTTDVIRYQIVSSEPVSETARIKKTQEVKEDIKKSLKEEKAIEEPKAKRTKKVDLKDLDEKLDKILDVDGLL